MPNLNRALVGLAALAFVLAVVVAITGPLFLNIEAEGLSRASANLALLAIAAHFVLGDEGKA